MRKKITFTLVVGMLIQTVSGMVVINTTLVSLLHLRDEETAAMGNATAER